LASVSSSTAREDILLADLDGLVGVADTAVRVAQAGESNNSPLILNGCGVADRR
jgi:hypothetical protein